MVWLFLYKPFKTIRNKKDVLKNHSVSDGLRFIIIDQDWCPIHITPLNPFTYFWKKYVKKYFKNGWRVDWEKELKKYHKSP